MKLASSAALAAALGLALALPASAQSMKPGLWEITNNMADGNGKAQSALADLQKEMADMDPEERKTMEQMMAKQGLKLGAGPGGGMVTKMCITPEMARRKELPMQQKGDCTHNQSTAGAGKMKFSFACANPRTTGEGEVTFSGDTSYKMKMKVVSGKTKDDVMTMDASARWIGADCGSVKPIALPKAK
jgi:hypothetical protein